MIIKLTHDQNKTALKCAKITQREFKRLWIVNKRHFKNNLYFVTKYFRKVTKQHLARWLYCVECPHRIRLEALGSLRASCILRAFDATQNPKSSVTWLNSRSSLPACVVCYAINPRPTSQKTGEVSCTYCTGHGNDFENWFQRSKWRLPAEGSFGNKLPSVLQSLQTAELWRPEVARRWKNQIFDVFSKNDPLLGNFQICSDTIHREIDGHVLFKYCEIWPTGNR